MGWKMEHLYKIIIGAILLICLSACGDKQGKQISAIIPLAESNPDSALKALSKIDQIRLSDRDMALYALVYNMAQDKSGLVVDNDSLLRNAYNWYHDKPTDSLYAKCEYYMGKYYSLNDSSEKALRCFANSIKVASQRKDYYIQSMALLQSSVIITEYNPDLAIRYAKNAINTYNNVKDGPQSNKVYVLLNLAECLFYKDGDTMQCINLCTDAISLAKQLNDSLAIADSYQDLSSIYSMNGEYELALQAARKVYEYNGKGDVSSAMCLALALCNADSLSQSLAIIHKIPRKEYKDNGSAIYSLLHTIALKEKDYDGVNAYKDSLIQSLSSENNENAEAKDRYYSSLISKERLRAQSQNESRLKSGIIITLALLSIIVIAFILYIARYRKRQMLIRSVEIQKRKQLIIEHQRTRISTMRNYLMSKVSILRKLESLKNGTRKQVLLSDSDWNELEVFLNSSDDEFVERLQREFADLTKKDIRFLMLIKIGLPYSTIAQIYNIEPKSVKQKLFLIKNKLGLKNSQKSAKEFIVDY